MYDELVKRLRRCEQFRCRECEYEQVMGCRAKLNEEAADAIEELSKPRWIPVKERVPSENDRYLIVAIEPWFGSTIVDIMRWSGVWMYDGRQTEATVTHWMPLPEPPEEET